MWPASSRRRASSKAKLPAFRSRPTSAAKASISSTVSPVIALAHPDAGDGDGREGGKKTHMNRANFGSQIQGRFHLRYYEFRCQNLFDENGCSQKQHE